MLPYNELNKFYTGSDEKKRTPLTSNYLNSIINQVEKDFDNIDKRLSNVESYLGSNSLKIYEAKITNAEINNANIIKANIEELSSNSIKIENADLKSLSSEYFSGNKVEGNEGNFTSISGDKIYYNYGKYNQLQIDELKISENYSFKTNSIEFENSKIINSSIQFYKNDNFASIEMNDTQFKIEYNINNVSNQFVIKTNSDFVMNYKTMYINGDIIPQSDISIGNIENPIDNIICRQFYGSYYSYNADVAEYYETDRYYEPGTLLMIGTDTEATIYNAKDNRPVLGVVSNSAAVILNKEMEKNGVLVALKGRVYCKLSNKGKRGYQIIPDYDNPGYCLAVEKSENTPIIGYLIDPDKNIIKV